VVGKKTTTKIFSQMVVQNGDESWDRIRKQKKQIQAYRTWKMVQIVKKGDSDC